MSMPTSNICTIYINCRLHHVSLIRYFVLFWTVDKLTFFFIATPPPPTSPPPGTCPKGQQHRGIYCYQGDVGASKSWPEANFMCQKIRMNLLSIHSQEESKFILNTMVTPTTSPSRYSRTPNTFWIGMNKGTSGKPYLSFPVWSFLK